MAPSGYGVVTLEEAAWSSTADGADHASLTEGLGTTETAVEAYRLGAGDSARPPVDRETLLVPLAADAPIDLDGSVSVVPSGIGFVPAGIAIRVRSRTAATVLVVTAPATPAGDAEPRAVDLDTRAYRVPRTSDVATAFLTAPLGCAGMKVNARRLEPGQVVPYHTEGEQEELFIPVRGPASMRIDDASVPMAVGTVARVAPAVPRSAVNDGERTARWVMVGAPPTGGPRDWDPGAEIVD